MQLTRLIQLTLCGLGCASPLTNPTVTIANGTVVGTSSGGVDSFKGIPFAEPPTGTLRLKPPQAIKAPYGTISATAAASCPQFFTSVNDTFLPEKVIGLLADLPIVQKAQDESEDCLTVTVQRPSGTTKDSKLPVLFWIFGGGFELGATSMYDGTGIVQESVLLKHDIIYVAVNYRVGGFGFLAGKELQEDGSTNLGLRDQRAGLEWVAENIEAFGGDKSKVTIWGESAGSISVFDQMIINGGNNLYKGEPLFHGAMMSSGSAVPALPVNNAKPQAIYDAVVDYAKCNTASNTLECLRALPYEQFLNACNSVPGLFDYQSLDISYLPRPDPSNSFFPISPDEVTKVPSIPIIIGDQQDEGTLFSLVQSNISTSDELVTYLASYFPETSRSLVQGLVNTYPDDPSAGSPFNTGPLNEIYPQFKRLAAILGDATFTLTRRVVLNKLLSQMAIPKAWSYLDTYLYGTPVLGTFHGTDILVDFEGVPLPLKTTEVRNYFISFVNYGDPNTIGNIVNWPEWTTSGLDLLEIKSALTVVTKDNFRQTSYEYFEAHSSSFRV